MDNCTKFRRVSKSFRCPICDRPDWCLLAGPEQHPAVAICARVESAHRCGEAGWLHRLRQDKEWASRPRPRAVWTAFPSTYDTSKSRLGTYSIDFDKMAASCNDAARDNDIEYLVWDLGVSAHGLKRLGVGWSAEHRAYTFPMRAPSGRVVGIRLRLRDGRKLSVRGGHEQLFVPQALAICGPLLIAEGPTDTAAILDLGFDAIGRPSCTGGTRHVIDYCKIHLPTDVVVVADNDLPGRLGAERLAEALVAYVPNLKLVTPPIQHKDIRAWKRAGATRDDLNSAIDAAHYRPLQIRSRNGGPVHA